MSSDADRHADRLEALLHLPELESPKVSPDGRWVAWSWYRIGPAADVYAAAPHTGRGGWTWYTGSSGWMYRLITESLLGLQLEADTLRFAPCIPPTWPSFKVHYRYRETFYHIAVQCAGGGQGIERVAVDGIEQPEKAIRLVGDRVDHDVQITMFV